jgi:UDP-glucuronate 4-epimerase
VSGRVLVTGAAGFIGSHLAEALLREGCTVVGVDNFDPMYDRAAKEANLAGARAHAGFEFVEADLGDGRRMQGLFDGAAGFEAIVHLAARAGVRPSIEDPAGYARANIQGTTALLDLAVRQEPRPRFVFGSSSSVYGNAGKVPFSEADRVDQPISPYAATKKAGELLCYTYHHLYDLPVYCLRFFTVYGPRQRPDLAIAKFARRILSGRPIQMFGDGTSSRDYTYIDDIIAGVLEAVRRCAGYEIINLGSSHPIRLADMIRTVGQACGREPVVERQPMQPGDVTRTFADVAKAGRLLGYAPAMPFAEGVAREVAWLRQSMAT